MGVSKIIKARFRAVLFRMVPKQNQVEAGGLVSFRAVLFRMVPKQTSILLSSSGSFRAVLFRMVPKQRLNGI